MSRVFNQSMHQSCEQTQIRKAAGHHARVCLYLFKPHSLPDTRRSRVEDTLAGNVQALLPKRDMCRVQWTEYPDNDLMHIACACCKGICDVKCEAIIPAAAQECSMISVQPVSTCSSFLYATRLS